MIRKHKNKPGKPYYSEYESTQADLSTMADIYAHIELAIQLTAELRQYRAIPLTENKKMKTLNNAEFSWMTSLLKIRQEITAFNGMYAELFGRGREEEKAIQSYENTMRELEGKENVKKIIRKYLAAARYRARKDCE